MLKLTLYGSGTSDFNFLRSEISEYLDDQRVSSNWIEVTAVDEFLRRKLASIPAVSVNDQFIAKKTEESVNQFASRVRDELDEILSGKTTAREPRAPEPVDQSVEIKRIVPNKRMKILLPFDRNEHSKNAILYAAAMADGNDEIHVFHVLPPILPTDSGRIPINNEEQIVKAEKEIEKIIATIPISEGKRERIRISVAIGFVVDQVTKKLDEGYNMIVLGTRNKYQIIDKIFGTVSLGIIKQKNIPLMLIGAQTEYQPIERVLIGCDGSMVTTENLEAICDWNKDYNAYLIFAHVNEGSLDFFIDGEAELIRKFLKKKKRTFDFEINILESGDIARKLILQSEKKKADLIMTIPGHQSFISSLLVKSVSKDLILQAQVPLFFL